MVGKEKLFFGVPETALLCDLDPKTVRREIERGTIPGQRFGRIWKVPLWWIKQQRDGVPGNSSAA
jgi:hypothetical protein